MVDYLKNEYNINCNDFQNSRKWTPLFYAISAQAVETTNYLLGNEIDFEHVSVNSNTIAHIAAQYNMVNVIDFIKQTEHLDLFSKTNVMGLTPLMIAAQNNHCETVTKILSLYEEELHSDMLITAQPKPNATNLKLFYNDYKNIKTIGWTALHFAVFHGHLPVVRYLSHLVKPNEEQVDQNGYMLFHLAVISGNIQLVKYLKESGYATADVNGKDNLALYNSSRHIIHADVLVWLIENLNFLDIVNKTHNTPLHRSIFNAINTRHISSTLKIMLRHPQARRTLIGSINNIGTTPLDMLSQNMGYSPMHISVIYGDLDHVKDQDPIYFRPNVLGDTPADLAFYFDFDDIFLHLFDKFQLLATIFYITNPVSQLYYKIAPPEFQLRHVYGPSSVIVETKDHRFVVAQVLSNSLSLKEAKAITRLNADDSIVSIIDNFAIESKNHRYILSETAPFGTLSSFLVDFDEPLSEELIRTILFQVCTSISYMNESRVVHRNLSADAIYLFSADFSKIKLGRIGEPTHLSDSLQAPEVLLHRSFSHKSDIW
eukprot:CAMPEP_0117420512 /NCGR_PEP_ID=MMETSP0758-20121206/1831_1 /TAXON_ID=63605 /ORGANISM="Percolomonas cosmopolitus, Strain AE-1 (ATCC 50343)" /LENGTH=542 /DNA_ID=CAMNT_0005202165 /DNA_START=1219 /DNA_END=2844 /DNA_ORIENTATION=-